MVASEDTFTHRDARIARHVSMRMLIHSTLYWLFSKHAGVVKRPAMAALMFFSSRNEYV